MLATEEIHCSHVVWIYLVQSLEFFKTNFIIIELYKMEALWLVGLLLSVNSELYLENVASDTQRP